MSSVALHNFLNLIPALALQLVLTIVVGALVTSAYDIHHAWVRQRERIDRQQQHSNQQQRDMNLLYVERDILTDRVGHLEQRLLEHIHNDRVIIPYRLRIALPANEQRPQPVQQHQHPLFTGLDGQDEQKLGTDDEHASNTRVVGNPAAQSSRVIAEATDPRLYGIVPRPSRSSNDDNTPSPPPDSHADQCDDSLGGSTLCDEAKRPLSYFHSGYEERPDDYFGHWCHYDNDDPEPLLPHPQDGHIVVATTTTQATPVATVVGPIPPTSVTAVAASQNMTQDPRITLLSLAAGQDPGAIFQSSSGLARQDEDDILPKNRINFPASRFQCVQIRQLNCDLDNVHDRRNAHRIESEQAHDSDQSSASLTPSLWIPPRSSPKDASDTESHTRSIQPRHPCVQTRSIENENVSSTNAGFRQPSPLSEEEAAFLHGTPKQWPEPSHQIDVTEETDEGPERDFSIPSHHHEYAQRQVDEFLQRHPWLARDKEEHSIYQSTDYDPVAVSQAIAKLNRKLARAQKWPANDLADDDYIAELIHKINWLKTQRNYAESSEDQPMLPDGGMRGGAGCNDDTVYDFVKDFAESEQPSADNEEDWFVTIVMDLYRGNL